MTAHVQFIPSLRRQRGVLLEGVPDPAKVQLLFGLCRPRLGLGERATSLYRDKLVVVHGFTDAPLSWPLCRPVEGEGRPGILVENELALMRW